jgi:hypothetical protein
MSKNKGRLPEDSTKFVIDLYHKGIKKPKAIKKQIMQHQFIKIC